MRWEVVPDPPAVEKIELQLEPHDIVTLQELASLNIAFINALEDIRTFRPPPHRGESTLVRLIDEFLNTRRPT